MSLEDHPVEPIIDFRTEYDEDPRLENFLKIANEYMGKLRSGEETLPPPADPYYATKFGITRPTRRGGRTVQAHDSDLDDAWMAQADLSDPAPEHADGFAAAMAIVRDINSKRAGGNTSLQAALDRTFDERHQSDSQK